MHSSAPFVRDRPGSRCNHAWKSRRTKASSPCPQSGQLYAAVTLLTYRSKDVLVVGPPPFPRMIYSAPTGLDTSADQAWIRGMGMPKKSRIFDHVRSGTKGMVRDTYKVTVCNLWCRGKESWSCIWIWKPRDNLIAGVHTQDKGFVVLSFNTFNQLGTYIKMSDNR